MRVRRYPLPTAVVLLLTHLSAPALLPSVLHTLPPRTMQAEKRRESMMVGLNKTRDALSASEERIRALQLDVQRGQMDLLAKTSASAGARSGQQALLRACVHVRF